MPLSKCAISALRYCISPNPPGVSSPDKCSIQHTFSGGFEKRPELVGLWFFRLFDNQDLNRFLSRLQLES